SLRNNRDAALHILYIPCCTAGWSPEYAEVRQRTASPQRSVPGLVSRQPGVACHPSLIVNAVSAATGSSERVEFGYLVLLCLFLCLCLRLRLYLCRCQSRPAACSDQDR